jgi:multidrug efflux pump subunit AcrB
MSLIVALTFVPAICSYLLPSRIQKKYEIKYPSLSTETNINEQLSEQDIKHIIEKEEDTWLTKKLK